MTIQITPAMTTANAFVKSGITGQTFREITEQFGKNFTALSEEDEVMANFALGFAWYREKEHLHVPEAFKKAMTLTTQQIEDLFEDGDDPKVKAVADFDSPPPTTTP